MRRVPCQGLSFAMQREEHAAVVGRAGKKQCSCCSPSLSLLKKKKKKVSREKKKSLSGTKKFQYYLEGKLLFSVGRKGRGGEGCSPAWREQ